MRIRGEGVTRWCVLLFGAMLVASIASGQTSCALLGDDMFDMGCCVPPQPNIAQIAWPDIDVVAAYAGFADCTTFITSSPTVKIQLSSFPLCDYGVAGVSIAFPGPGFEAITGSLYMKYARTWMDGSQTQVWRFLVNGDLTCTGGPTPAQCVTVLPPCVVAGPLGPGVVHWEGHVDYACAQGAWSVSLSLNHLPGLYTHDPLSCAFVAPPYDHPLESYHFVYPAPFVFGSFPPPSGPLIADSVRRSILNPPNYACMSEIHLQPLGGLTTAFNLLCQGSPCVPFPPFCQCWNAQLLNALSCPANGTSMSVFSVNLGTPFPLPTTGFASYTIGHWPFIPAPTVYPWSSTLTLYLGTIVATPDPCNTPMNVFHVVTGVSTYDEPLHFQANLFNTGLCTCGNLQISHACIDLNNVLLLGNNFLIGYGCAAASDLVLSLNLP